MKSSPIYMTVFLILSFLVSHAQIKNPKTETVKISGNCEMCKSTIEKAGTVKNEAKVEWNKDTKLASITYDTTKTNQDEILKRIALAGYDSEKFLAPDEIYAHLPECCQYERVNNIVTPKETSKNELVAPANHAHSTTEKQQVDQLTALSDGYFAVKNSLILSDGSETAKNAKTLLSQINAVKKEKLTNEEHMIFIKVLEDLKLDAKVISETTDISKQRTHLSTLSENIYKLIKVSKHDTPVYYQHCPMYNDGKGANWLSKENTIKNPYYGSQMLSCGKTLEIIN